MNPFRCESLAAHHDRAAFRCGLPELDAYLQTRAGQDVRRQVAAVFVMAPDDEPHRVAGFYTLSAASVVCEKVVNQPNNSTDGGPLLPPTGHRA